MIASNGEMKNCAFERDQQNHFSITSLTAPNDRRTSEITLSGHVGWATWSDVFAHIYGIRLTQWIQTK